MEPPGERWFVAEGYRYGERAYTVMPVQEDMDAPDYYEVEFSDREAAYDCVNEFNRAEWEETRPRRTLLQRLKTHLGRAEEEEYGPPSYGGVVLTTIKVPLVRVWDDSGKDS